ncbi:hypothetical protein GCM10027082_24610 [Comamonas humi]
MDDPKLEAVRAAADAFAKALTAYGRPVDVEVRKIEFSAISQEEPRVVYELRLSRTSTERLYP